MATCAALAVVFAGCIFSPDKASKPKPNPPPVYPVLQFPERVLSALQIAYEARDSVGYLKLFDYDYLGTSEDLTDGTNATFRNSDERDHIQALAAASNVSAVKFDMGPYSSWRREPSDNLSHPEWAIIQVNGASFHVVIYTTDRGDLTVTGTTETFTYTFKPTSTVPGDTLWNIIRWKEIRAP